METLLGLTSKRAGGWFKDELRRLKGIDYIVNTVLRCAEDYLEEGHMVKIDRCMHVLENVGKFKKNFFLIFFVIFRLLLIMLKTSPISPSITKANSFQHVSHF